MNDVDRNIAEREEDAEIDRTAVMVEAEQVLIRARREAEQMQHNLHSFGPYYADRGHVYRATQRYAMNQNGHEYQFTPTDQTADAIAVALNVAFRRGMIAGVGMMQDQATDVLGQIYYEEDEATGEVLR